MDTFKSIDPQEAHEIMGSGKVTIVDIRDAGAFAQGHITEAHSVNDGNIEGFLQKTDKALPLICYCYHGISSRQAADFFAQQGFEKVYSINGGWEKWKTFYG